MGAQSVRPVPASPGPTRRRPCRDRRAPGGGLRRCLSRPRAVPRELAPPRPVARRSRGAAKRASLGRGRARLACHRRRRRALPRPVRGGRHRGPARRVAPAPHPAPRDLRARRSLASRRPTPDVLPDYLRRPDAELALQAPERPRERRLSISHSPRSRPRADPAPLLPRPAAGDRDRAPRLPDALVAGDVRARALQAVGHLPRGAGRRAARPRRLSDLLALRHRLARHEHRRRPRPPAQGHRHRAAGRALRARRRPDAPATRSRSAAPTTPPSTSTNAKASAPPACAVATTRTTARTRSSCGAPRPPSPARSTTSPTPAGS